MKLVAAAIQMACVPGDVPANIDHADVLLGRARDAGAELAVLPEMFNTGYARCADYSPYAEDRDGPTVRHLTARSREWGMTIVAGIVEREGRHLYDALGVWQPDGSLQFYRKRHLVFWERFRFRPGRGPVVVQTRWGRMGLAVCADMIYRRVWNGYRGRIDLAVVAAAWPDFACRLSGRKHWLFGQVGPLSGEIPRRVAADLDVPVVFANQCGTTRTFIPVLKTEIADHFAGLSSLTDGRHGPAALAGRDEQVVLSSLTIHPPRGPVRWRSMSPWARAASSCDSAPSPST